MTYPSRATTEVRGPDEYEDPDWPVGATPPHYPRKFPRAPSTEELRRRGFVSKPVSARCWCGRPVKDSTGQCLLEHDWHPEEAAS